MPPAISVLMPVWNAQPYLDASLASILHQTFDDFELIVIDDGSTDHSPQILKQWAARDARIKLHTRANSGIVGALNDGLRLAQGALIARMDADDLCAPGRFAQQVTFLRANPHVLAVGTALLYTDPRGRPLFATQPALAPESIEAELLRGHSMAIVHATAMFRAQDLKAVGYRQEFQFIEDLDLFLRLALRGKLANLPDVLYTYRQHQASTNATKLKQQQRLKTQILAEAHAARGLPAPPPAPAAEAPTLSEIYADWSCKAFLGGNRGPGLLYAFRFLLAGGISLKKLSRFAQMLRLART